MKVAQDFRGIYLNTSYLGAENKNRRAILHYHLPLNSILVNFYDQIKVIVRAMLRSGMNFGISAVCGAST